MDIGISRKNTGFTIVELLIVVVVVAILAAITVVSYNGIAQKSVEVTMQHDLQNAVKSIEMESIRNRVYPASSEGLNEGRGLVGSGNNQLTYTRLGTGYCVDVSNTRVATQLKISSSTGKIVPGTCSLNNGGVVTTLAGSGVAGFADGNGTAAQFNAPQGIAVDSAGVVYVSDGNNYRIRQIMPNGEVTTLAGSSSGGSTNGTGAAARFYNPKGLAVDSGGTIYVADQLSNGVVRKIAPGGVVTHFVGSPSVAGYVDANGTAARFGALEDVAIDASGTLYILDRGNGRIRKASPSGDVTSLSGSGTTGFADGAGASAQFNLPKGIAVDSSGTVYIADSGNHRIRKIAPNGDVTTFAGSGVRGGADGTGTSAQFDTPNGVAVDGTGNVYVADSYNHRIRKITPSGVVTTLAGGSAGYADGTGAAAGFNFPRAIAVDSEGVLYVSETTGNRIRKIQ